LICPYVSCSIVVFVDDCHDVCCREVHLVGGRVFIME